MTPIYIVKLYKAAQPKIYRFCSSNCRQMIKFGNRGSLQSHFFKLSFYMRSNIDIVQSLYMPKFCFFNPNHLILSINDKSLNSRKSNNGTLIFCSMFLGFDFSKSCPFLVCFDSVVQVLHILTTHSLISHLIMFRTP